VRAAIGASQTRFAVLPRPGAREGLRIQSAVDRLHPRERAPFASGGALDSPSHQRRRLENADFDVQEFLGIFAEIRDQQAHVARKAGHIVVEGRIGEELAD
jgi:hypothetical protein